LIGEEKPQNWSGTEAEMTLKEIFHSWFADSEIQAGQCSYRHKVLIFVGKFYDSENICG